MIEKATNITIGAVQTVVSWLSLFIKIQQALLTGLDAALEHLKFQ